MNTSTIVLKFGGSVLRNDTDLAKAVHEIYGHFRNGKKVLAVVSAFYGKTDELIESTRQFGENASPAAIASLLATGESTSASLLTLALDRSGLPAKILNPHQACIRTAGAPLDAEPVSADIARIRQELESAVVVVSGFVGIGECGQFTLLGRGGTDFTALFLAEQLSAECSLVKDVDGLYDSDPAVSEGRRFAHANFSTAIELGGELVQAKAVNFAAKHGLAFRLTTFNSTASTLVGDFSDEFADDARSGAPLRVALLGCGTVGGGVYNRLNALPRLFEVTGVANLKQRKALSAGIDPKLITNDIDSLIEGDCEAVIELIGGVERPFEIACKTLKLGKHFVTANKALLAKHQAELEALAEANGVTIRYSASVGGVLPALETVTRITREDSLQTLSGIINGTCNFICDRLAEGETYETALRLAQEAGFTEADPTLDLNGTDAAQKLVLLAKATFGVELPLENIERTGIDSVSEEVVKAAKNEGKLIRLVAECVKTADGIRGSVKPVAVDVDHPFAAVRGADNILSLETTDGRTKIVKGRGAGRFPTTESVIADLFDLRRHFETAPAKALQAKEVYA